MYVFVTQLLYHRLCKEVARTGLVARSASNTLVCVAHLAASSRMTNRPHNDESFMRDTVSDQEGERLRAVKPTMPLT